VDPIQFLVVRLDCHLDRISAFLLVLNQARGVFALFFPLFPFFFAEFFFSRFLRWGALSLIVCGRDLDAVPTVFAFFFLNVYGSIQKTVKVSLPKILDGNVAVKGCLK